MASNKNAPDQDLRQRAENTIEAPLDQSDMAKALHELRVHQIELEMQNDELRRTQHELEVSRVRYFDLYNLAPVGYCTIDKQGLILEANLTAATQFGVTRGVLIQQPLTRFILPQDRDVYARLCHQLFATDSPQVCELRMQPLDAAPFWALLKGNLAHETDGTLLCRLVINDISARKQTEEALQQSEEKYRTVADFTHDWEFWLGPEGNFLYCSPSCQKITGHSAAAFEKDSSLLRSLVHPDDLVAYDQHHLHRKEMAPSQEFEFRINRADKSTGWRWISHVCQTVFDDKGQFLGSRGSNRDVTDRKFLESEAVKATNLESLGMLAGCIAHDFNNLFQGLLGSIELATMYIDESNKAFPLLGNASQLCTLATKLTSQLISLSPSGISTQVKIEPAKHIKEEVASSLEGSDLVVEFDLADDLQLINSDPFQFHQVIKHIVLNAKEAMASGAKGSLKVRAINETLLETSGKSLPLPPGNYVKISIQDQGHGISNEHLPRIFDPYFSTKQRGFEKGMGLGLALCNAITRKIGGAITVESEPGNGTTFHIHIPAVNTVAIEMKTIQDQGTGPRILLMDDDLGIAEVTTMILRRSGYRVDSASDGVTTIAAYEEAIKVGDPYKVVILDLVIPGGMGGKETIAKLKRIDPDIKAIVSSGYASDEVMTDFAKYGFIAACAKPYRFSEIIEVIGRYT